MLQVCCVVFGLAAGAASPAKRGYEIKGFLRGYCCNRASQSLRCSVLIGEVKKILLRYLQLMLAKLVQPYHLKVFFSNKFVHASVIDTLRNVCVTSVSSNNKLFAGLVGASKPKNDVRACLALAKLLAEKAQGQQVIVGLPAAKEGQCGTVLVLVAAAQCETLRPRLSAVSDAGR